MRLLFNHGLTTEELYSNVPLVVTRQKFKKNVRNFSSLEAAYGSLLSYCFGMILHEMVVTRKRFVFPSNKNTSIDFHFDIEDSFELNRQIGRYKEVDFIYSDFTGYYMRVETKIKGISKYQRVLVGGYIQKKFIESINSGIKFYTIRDLYLTDMLDTLYQKFTWMDKADFVYILKFGLKRLELALRCQLAISFVSRLFKGNEYGLHIGRIYSNEKKQLYRYKRCMDRKHRRLYTWRKTEYDGYFYIGLSQNAYDELMQKNKYAKKLLYFEWIYCRKIMEEMFYRYPVVYIFRFPRTEKNHWGFNLHKVKLDKVEYLGRCEKLAFTPSTKKWKELIKEYEKANN